MEHEMNLDELIKRLSDLKVGEWLTISAEDPEGRRETLDFYKMQFLADTIILYNTPNCDVGILQDTAFCSWEDLVEDLFNYYTNDLECIILIQ